MATESLTPQEALAARLATDPTSPLLTYYDDATGERVELSAVTFANWVFKGANLLRDGVGLDSGDVLAVALPLHWQSFAVVHSAWQLGASVQVLGNEHEPLPRATALARFADGDSRLDTSVDDVLVMGLRPMAMPGPAPAPPAIDVDREIRAHGDVYSGARVAPTALADYTADGTTLTQGQVVERARSLFAPGSTRVSIEIDGAAAPDDLRTWRYAGLAALLSGRGLVLSVGTADAETRARRRDSEQATLIR